MLKKIQSHNLPSRLIAATLIADIFADAIDGKFESITTREILGLLGIKVDKYENVVYDLTSFSRNNIAFFDESIIKDFGPKPI